ncbi:MAG: hypothetical protein K0R54_4793 [Clostridiaceae bacterium]|nr:hypothetical protein [Clostridiaceae bacterium]
MGYTKEQRQQKLTEQVKENVEEKIETKTTSKRKIRLDDSVGISVASNVFGLLTYINHKTGDKYQWDKIGDVQTLYVSDIRAMKSNQQKFLEENWILIEGIADLDEAYEDVELDDIYEALQISHYYNNRLCPKNIGDIFNWSVADIKAKVPKMNTTVKESLAIRANELIKSGVLDSISKLKAFEEVLGCELTAPDEE